MERRIINEKIPNHQLLVIDDEGNKLGIMQRDDAIALAQDKGLDLVLFVPSHNNQPALAKIIDYGKFAYEQKLKEKHAHKNQTVIKVKEVKVRPQTGDHDLKWRAEQVKGWLNDGYQIKFKIQAFGRIGFKPELIQETYDRFIALVGEIAKVITPLKKLTPVMYEATIVKNK